MSKGKAERKNKYEKKFERVNVRYLKTEYELLEKKAAQIKLDVTNFVKKSSLKNEVINDKIYNDDYKLILKELKKIGTNINQITMKINATKNLSSDEKERLFSLLNELKKVIFKDILFKK